MLLALDDSPPDNCTVFVPGSHRLTVSEKEERYGITAEVKAVGNVRYAGNIAAAFREPCPLRAGEAVPVSPGASPRFLRVRQRGEPDLVPPDEPGVPVRLERRRAPGRSVSRPPRAPRRRAAGHLHVLPRAGVSPLAAARPGVMPCASNVAPDYV